MTLNGGTAETRTYDGWGRLASRAQGSYAASYGYRYGGRLHAFTSNFPGEAGATLQYRGDGRMYQRTVGADTFTYRYDAGWNPVNMEYANGTLASTSVYAPGTAVGERMAYAYGDLATGVTVYACHDQLGSVRRWRTPSKGNWGANEFEPYGEAYAVSTLAPRDYALHEWDPALAVYRAPYRNYSPTMTRWTTRDPLGMIDGPNMYGYVGGRTMTGIDALGLSFGSCVDDCWQNNPIPTCVDVGCQAACAAMTIVCGFGGWFNPGCIALSVACAACTMMYAAKLAACLSNCFGDCLRGNC